MYLNYFYDEPLSDEDNWIVISNRIFEMGHSFEYIENMTVDQMSGLLAQWGFERKVKDRQAQQSKRKRGGK